VTEGAEAVEVAQDVVPQVCGPESEQMGKHGREGEMLLEPC